MKASVNGIAVYRSMMLIENLREKKRKEVSKTNVRRKFSTKLCVKRRCKNLKQAHNKSVVWTIRIVWSSY